MKRLLSVALFAIIVAACARQRPAVDYVGRSKPTIVAPAAVEESSVLPRNAEQLGRLVARCRAFDTASSFEGRPLSDVDCSEPRLRLWLKQAASEHGGDVLSEIRCRTAHTSDCSAILGRRGEGDGVPSPSSVPEASDVSGGFGAGIWVSYSPKHRGFERHELSPGNVRELSSLPPSHFVVGSLETECEGCDERALRQAMRVTAAKLGASDVISVRCVTLAECERCVGEAAAPERFEH
jgi:hypothetical protein